jgi:hypothetical protein
VPLRVLVSASGTFLACCLDVEASTFKAGTFNGVEQAFMRVRRAATILAFTSIYGGR